MVGAAQARWLPRLLTPARPRAVPWRDLLSALPVCAAPFIDSWSDPLVPVLVFPALVAWGIRRERIPRVPAIAAAVLAASVTLSAAVSGLLRGEVAFANNLMFLLLLLPAMSLLWTATRRSVRLALGILGTVGAASIVADGLTGSGRASGLLPQDSYVNAAGGLMVLAAVLLWTWPPARRHAWASAPLLAALVLTGSRWALATAVIVLVLLAVTRTVPWRRLVLAAGLTALLVTPFVLSGDAGASLRLTSEDPARSWAHDLWLRFQSNGADGRPPSLLPPMGFDNQTLQHNTPARVALDAGPLAAAAWLLLYGLALRRGWRAAELRWLLLTAGVLSLMDIYLWLPVPLGALWWAMLGAALRVPEAER